MKILMAFTLLFVASIHVSDANTIQMQGAIAEFSCSAVDQNDGCAALYKLQTENNGKNKTAKDIQALVATKQHSELFNMSVQPLQQGQLMVVLADYL